MGRQTPEELYAYEKKYGHTQGREKDFSTERVTLSSGQRGVSLGWSHNWVQQCATRRDYCPLKLQGHARCLGPAWVPTGRGREYPRPLLG